jgi:Ca-activated chloride channel family protein
MSRSAPGIRLRFPPFLRKAPWLALSIALNAVICLGIPLLLLLRKPAVEQPDTVFVRTAPEEMGLPAEEVKPDIEERAPVLADSDLPFEESLGRKDFLSDAPFDGPSTNAAIGIGGGAGGAFGVRGGHRQLRAGGGGGNANAEQPPRGFDREAYDSIGEDGFSDPRKAPLSTFSIDVDTASYANVRRILREGRLPPEGAVRIEELLNYFSYEYPPPDDGQPFSVVAEVAECPWNPAHRLVHFGIQGRVVPDGEVQSRNLVFLLDVSGSMQSPDKLPLVVDAMRLLVDQLREEDRVAIVVYAGESGVVLPPTAGRSRSTIRDALDRLSAGGSTNGGEGIRLAYALAREHFVEGGINRVILATDGDFNVGTTSRSELENLIEKERESGVFLTVLGVGAGNLQDSQMEMLADKGNGNYAYLDTIREAKKVLVTEVGGTLVTIARDVKIQVEFNPARVGGYRLIGYENRKLADRDFNDDQKDAGEIGAGHSVTALYEILPAGEHPETGAVDPLKYQDPTVPTVASSANEILTLKLRYKQPDGEESMLISSPLEDPGNVNLAATTRDFQFAAAVATFGLALRNSPHCPNANFALAAELAHPAQGEDPEGLRREFLELCRIAGELVPGR